MIDQPACGRHTPRCACVGRRTESDPHSTHCDLHAFHGVTTAEAGNVTRTIAFAADSNGITMTISREFGANRRPLSSDDEVLSFTDAAELHRALGELLHNPSNELQGAPSG